MSRGLGDVYKRQGMYLAISDAHGLYTGQSTMRKVVPLQQEREISVQVLPLIIGVVHIFL